MKHESYIKRNDSAIWRNIKSGDSNALGEVFRKHFDDLYYYGLKIVPVPDLVKDAIQDVFVKVWERKKGLSEIENFKAYLLTSLRRDLLQKIRNSQEIDLNESFESRLFTFSREDFMINEENSAELSVQLTACLADLTPRQREVIMLRFHHCLEFPEMAEVLQMNVQSVRNLLFRAIEKIREQLSSSDLTSAEDVELFLFLLLSKN